MAQLNKQKPRHVQSLCAKGNGELARIIKAANALKRIEKQLKTLLPQDLAQHYRVVNYQKNQLLLAADNGHWAGRFRLLRADLLIALRQKPGFAGLSAIECRVMPMPEQVDTRQAKKTRNFKLDADNTAALQSLIETSTDPKLTTKLQQFLRHYGCE